MSMFSDSEMNRLLDDASDLRSGESSSAFGFSDDEMSAMTQDAGNITSELD